jgi:hypothetical protein
MRIWHCHILPAIALTCVAVARAQGTFENLNFENGDIVPIVGSLYYPYAVTVANALPGWTVDYGSVQQTQILYNAPSTGATAVTLLASGYPGSAGPIIDGNYSVFLQGGLFNGTAANASISQTGQIPAGTQSLLFEVGNLGENLLPEVFIGSDQLSLFPVGSGAGVSVGYTTYGANISAWAGQTEQLTFSSPGMNVLLDDISFSPNATVPEPTPLALAGLGTALFAIYRRRYTMQR